MVKLSAKNMFNLDEEKTEFALGNKEFGFGRAKLLVLPKSNTYINHVIWLLSGIEVFRGFCRTVPLKKNCFV